MRKLIKNILRENEWDWANKVEPKLTKGLILCPNHERFKGGCLEVLKVDKRKDRHAPDKLVYLQSLETGNRYANTLKQMMQWLSDGEYIITYQPLKESDDLDWIKGVDTYYKVEQLEVGKMYEFEPDYSIMGKWEGYDDFPSWLSSYEGQNFYIIKQEPKPRFPKIGEITFKQIGESNKMVYDGKYVKLPYNARVFLWGKFKEVDTPEFVTESNDLDWIKDEKLNLGQYFDTNNFNEGDEFTLMGELMGGHSNSPKNWSNEPFKVVINTVGENFRDCTFNISIDYCDAVKKMEISRDCSKWPEDHVFLNNYFVDEDRDLTVISHKNDVIYIYESNDFDWIENIKPIPSEILNIDKYPPGDYKIWLGDMPKQQQLLIIDYIIDVIESRDDISTSSSLYGIRDIVRRDEAYFNSLYFDIHPPDLDWKKKKSIVVAMMAWYPQDGLDKYDTLEYCIKYFDRHSDTELSTAKINE